MATKLDILVWDHSFRRVRHLQQKFPAKSIRKAIDSDDFVEGLSHSPKLVIIGQQQEQTEEQLKQTFKDELTEETYVLIWYVGENNRETVDALQAVDQITYASGFSFTSQYLWISTYNILKNG